MDVGIQEYHGIKNKIVDIARKYQEDTQTQAFIEHLNHKLKHFNPTVMIYGVYNAGKSTLLNAIFGKSELAKTGDAPETAKVSAYRYNNYTIYDTPGIHAPIEHQKVTDEHLSKCELIIFVLSNSGSFEDKYIYEKIGEVIQSKKPILIAMNNKSGIDMDSVDAQNEMNKVNQHLITICGSMGIEKAEEKVSLVFVDAKTALEGKIENEQELIEESKIEQFEKTMNHLLGKSGKSEVANALNLYITDYLNDTLTLIDKKIDNPEMKKTQDLITYLEKLKQRTGVELRELAMHTTATAAADFLELMLVRDKKSIDDMVQKTMIAFNQKIQQRISEVRAELQNKIEKFEVEFKYISIEYTPKDMNVDMSDEGIESIQKQNSNVAMAKVGTSIATLIPPTVIIPTPLGPIPLKGLVMVVGGLFAAFSGSDDARVSAEEKLEVKRSQHLSAKNKSNEFGMRLKEILFQNIVDNIDRLFVNLIQDFISFSSQLDDKNSQLLDDKDQLQGIGNSLPRL